MTKWAGHAGKVAVHVTFDLDLTHGDFGGNVRALYSSEPCCL